MGACVGAEQAQPGQSLPYCVCMHACLTYPYACICCHAQFLSNCKHAESAQKSLPVLDCTLCTGGWAKGSGWLSLALHYTGFEQEQAAATQVGPALPLLLILGCSERAYFKPAEPMHTYVAFFNGLPCTLGIKYR